MKQRRPTATKDAADNRRSGARRGPDAAAAPDVDLDAAIARVMEAVRVDSRSAAACAAAATKLAEQIGTDEAIARAQLATAWAHAATSDFALTLAPAGRAERLFGRLADESRRAEANIVLGMASLRLGRLEEAGACYQAALESSRRAGDRLHEADALGSLGAHALMRGEYQRALELGAESLAIALEVGSDARLADAHTVIGNALVRLGHYDEARERYEQAVECARAAGEIRLEGYALASIGTILERLGDPSGALQCQLRSLACSEQLGDRWGINGILNNIAIVYQRLGKYSAALEHLTRALELAEEIGEPEGEAAALANIGTLFEAIGEPGRVLEYFSRSHAIAERVGDRHAIANSLILLGRHHAAAGDEKLALLSFMRALRLHEEMRDRHGRFAALYNMGRTLGTIGDHEGAVERLDEALELARAGGDRHSTIIIRIALGRVLSATGEHDRAVDLLEQSLADAEPSAELVLRTLDALTEVYGAAGRASDAAASASASSELLRRIFDSGETHRIRELADRLDQRNARRHASRLGVDAADVEEVARLLARVRSRDAAVGEPASSEATSTVPASTVPASIAPVATKPAAVDSEVTATMAAASDEATAPIVTVVTFGELRVNVGERVVAPSAWQRRRARDLFKLLLLNHRRSLSLDRIVEIFGGEIGDRGAELVIMNAVSHVRRALEPEKPSRERTTYLRHGDGAYVLDLGEGARIDFLSFKALVAKARRAESAGDRRRHYEEALALYHDDFLKEDVDAEWAESERSMLRDARLEALEFVASEQLRAERVEEAITTARSILGEDNTSERAHEILLQALVLRGRHGEARAAAAAMTRAFHDELGVQPPPHLQKMIERAVA